MTWVPELPPNATTTRQTLLEWLLRSFRRVSQWTANHIATTENPHLQYVRAGYGGIYLSSPVATGGLILPSSPTKIPAAAYNSTLTNNPIGVTQGLLNGSLVINEPGIWMITVSARGEFDPISANNANTIAVALYNETDGVLGNQPALFTVPRYGETFDVSHTVPVEFSSTEIGKTFSMYIWHYLGVDIIDITDWIATDFHAVRVSN